MAGVHKWVFQHTNMYLSFDLFVFVSFQEIEHGLFCSCFDSFWLSVDSVFCLYFCWGNADLSIFHLYTSDPITTRGAACSLPSVQAWRTPMGWGGIQGTRNVSLTCSILIYMDLGDLARQLSANNDVYSRSSGICVFSGIRWMLRGSWICWNNYWLLDAGRRQDVYRISRIIQWLFITGTDWWHMVTCPASFEGDKVSHVWMLLYPSQERMECHKTFQDLCMLHFGEPDIPLSLAGWLCCDDLLLAIGGFDISRHDATRRRHGDWSTSIDAVDFDSLDSLTQSSDVDDMQSKLLLDSKLQGTSTPDAQTVVALCRFVVFVFVERGRRKERAVKGGAGGRCNHIDSLVVKDVHWLFFCPQLHRRGASWC